MQDLTIGALIDALEAAGFGDDEYLSTAVFEYKHNLHRRSLFNDQLVFSDWVERVVCSWKPGNNEGYYVSIERVIVKHDALYRAEEPKLDHLITCKFWDWKRAQECCSFAQQLIYSTVHPYVPQPRAPALVR